MSKENSRFDARISNELKEIMERAANLGGYRSLTDFVMSSAQSKAKEIIRDHERIIASQRDSEIFMEAILNPPKPVDKLIKAAQDYKASLPE